MDAEASCGSRLRSGQRGSCPFWGHQYQRHQARGLGAVSLLIGDVEIHCQCPSQSRMQPISWGLCSCAAGEAALLHASFHRAPEGFPFRLTHVGKCTQIWCLLANFRSHMMHGCKWRCVLLCFPCNISTRESICRRCASQGGIPGIRPV